MREGNGHRRRAGSWRAAEFFAGIGLVRLALEPEGFDVVWANDIEASKRDLYAANFDASHFVLGDVRRVRGREVPDVDVATASFPCVDLSLAGSRAGLSGAHSGMFWEFARVLREMGDAAPSVVLLENVTGFASSHDGRDLHDALKRLNSLGYWCDVFVADAKWFVPQSRPRMFVVGSRLEPHAPEEWTVGQARPEWLCRCLEPRKRLRLQANALPPVRPTTSTVADVVERFKPGSAAWWPEDRSRRFLDSLSPLQAARLAPLAERRTYSWRTAYRRTRHGRAVWEIRPDPIAGCLRTARGGSSRQAVVETGRGAVRVRWMTPREYARLQGAPDFAIDGFRPNQVYFGFGDAVCVPVISWVAREYLSPLLGGRRMERAVG